MNIRIIFFLVSHLVCMSLYAQEQEPITDLRILVDVSGSMKKNDPNNLRTPAIKLLVDLMPNGTRAGIWTFGQYVNMQVKLNTVSEEWKNIAKHEAASIHSRGLRTNIEDAIKRSTVDWNIPDQRYRRNLILLTDGMVDISNNSAANQKSKHNILHKLLPRLQKAGATIHTIALSENADHELLRNLASATDGAHESTNDANQLHRVFLHLFEQSANTTNLPINDNQFEVDKNIKDMTLLVFRNESEKPTKISTPIPSIWSSDKHPDHVSWHQEAGYDLITVKNPMSGKWQIKAASDPDNRVLVVTNLRLHSNELPNNMLYTDELTIQSHLSQDDEIITKESFLELVQFSIKHSDPSGTSNDWPLSAMQTTAEIGKYAAKLPSLSTIGKHELILTAKSPTFAREIRRVINVIDSIVDVSFGEILDNGNIPVEITLAEELLQPSSIEILYTLPNGDSSSVANTVEEGWITELDQSNAGKQISFLVNAKRSDGNPFTQTIRKQVPNLEIQKMETVVDKKEQTISEEVNPTAQEEVTVDKTQPEAGAETTNEKAATVPAEVDSINWFWVWTKVIAINLVLGTVAGAGYWYYRKKRKLEGDPMDLDLGEVDGNVSEKASKDSAENNTDDDRAVANA